MAVQVGQHAGEGVDVGVDVGVIAHRFLSSAVLNGDWHNETCTTSNVHANCSEAAEAMLTISS